MALETALETALWLIDSSAVGDDDLREFEAWLTPGEQQRYRQFTRPLRQKQFLVGRIMMRSVLGVLMALPPAQVRLAEQRGAAPRLDMPGTDAIGFSISHSGPWIACAANLNTKVGLDIEVIDPQRDLDGLAAQAFEADALNRWRRSPEATRVRDFYELWCEYEAAFKLLPGTGECVRLHHPELAIALCSARRAKVPPALSISTFSNGKFSI